MKDMPIMGGNENDFYKALYVLFESLLRNKNITEKAYTTQFNKGSTLSSIFRNITAQ